MANISVAELLLDPDFVDPCTVQRQVMQVGDDGVVTYTQVTIPIYASIQAQGGDTLFTDPNLSRTEASYEVITTFPLVCATDATAADIVVWNGRSHRVTSIGRFGNFQNGFGHYEGVMESMGLTPVPTDAT